MQINRNYLLNTGRFYKLCNALELLKPATSSLSTLNFDMDHMDEYEINLLGGADDETGMLFMEKIGRECLLRFKYRSKMVEVTASDFFDAFCCIRLELQKENLIPFCYGASLNVYPSGMLRDMGRGIRAYKLVEGNQAKMADLVDIFAEGPDVIPAYVSPQKEFFEHWLSSLRA